MPALSMNDLDLEAAQSLFGDSRALDEKKLITLKILVRHQGRLVPTKGAVFLFGKERTMHFPDAWIQCGRFFGTEKLDIFDHVEIDEPLPRAVDEVMLFLKKHAYRGADLSEIRRRDVWSIPLGILREVVINALVHSDYSQRGAPTRIVFLDDRIEVENPGLLLPGLTVEDMKQGTSKIRNGVIARVFRELGLIEQWGTGVRRIFSEARELGLREPQIQEVGMRVRFAVYLKNPLVLDRGSLAKQADTIREEPVAQQGTQQVAQQATQQVTQQVARLMKIMSGEMSRAGMMGALSLKDRVNFSKNYLEPALTAGWVKMTQPDSPNSPTQKYRLTGKGQQFLAKTERIGKKKKG